MNKLTWCILLLGPLAAGCFVGTETSYDDEERTGIVEQASCGGLPDCQAECQCKYKSDHVAKKECLEGCGHESEDEGDSSSDGGFVRVPVDQSEPAGEEHGGETSYEDCATICDFDKGTCDGKCDAYKDACIAKCDLQKGLLNAVPGTNAYKKDQQCRNNCEASNKSCQHKCGAAQVSCVTECESYPPSEPETPYEPCSASCDYAKAKCDGKCAGTAETCAETCGAEVGFYAFIPGSHKYKIWKSCLSGCQTTKSNCESACGSIHVTCAEAC